ncbi:MAG: hypothetical protein WC087_03705 [Candidatus Paceibacterota bacterium]
MDLILVTLSGVTLIVLLITASIILVNKAVKKAHRFYVQYKIYRLLCEVTGDMKRKGNTPSRTHIVYAVAKKVLSPNSLFTEEDERIYNGANTFFIVNNDNSHTTTASFTYIVERGFFPWQEKEKKFSVSKTGNQFLFRNEAGDLFEHLLPKFSAKAEELLELAKKVKKRTENKALAKHIRQNSKRVALDAV